MSNRDDQSFAGSIPEHYERFMVPVLFADYAEEMARRIAALKPARVLETAAGTGVVSRALRNRLPPTTSLTVTDLSPAMLEIARGRFDLEPPAFQAASALQLPFENASFDVVLSQYGVMFYPDKEQAFREAFRVLAPGGRYIFSLWDAHQFNLYGHIAHEVVTSLFPDDPPQFMTIPFGYSFEAAKQPLLSAGFDDLQAAVVHFKKTGVDPDAFARGLIFGSPFGEQIKARNAVSPDEAVARIGAALGRDLGNPATLSLQATFISARKPA